MLKNKAGQLAYSPFRKIVFFVVGLGEGCENYREFYDKYSQLLRVGEFFPYLFSDAEKFAEEKGSKLEIH